MYDRTDQSRGRHFPEHAESKVGREAERFFLEELDKCPALNQQVQKSGVGNGFIHLISILFTPGQCISQFLLRQEDCWKNRNLLSITYIISLVFIDKDRQIVEENEEDKKDN